MTEVPLPVKFLFLLIGPAVDEYLEIGRSLSTLFTTPVSEKLVFHSACQWLANGLQDFRQIAYQAMDRRDLLGGINDFLSDSIVLPPGDFDRELLLPIIETAKMKNEKAKRRLTRSRNQSKHRANEQSPQSPAQCKLPLDIACPSSCVRFRFLLL